MIMAAFLAPLLGLAICMVGHVLITRYNPGIFKLTAIRYSFALGFLGNGAVLALTVFESASVTNVDKAGYALLWTLSYLSLIYCYFLAFFNVGESARRVRILIELDAAGNEGLTLQELLNAYNARMIVPARLERLVSSGQLVEKDGRYYVGKPFMLTVAKTFTVLKRLLLKAPSEFGKRG